MSVIKAPSVHSATATLGTDTEVLCVLYKEHFSNCLLSSISSFFKNFNPLWTDLFKIL